MVNIPEHGQQPNSLMPKRLSPRITTLSLPNLSTQAVNRVLMETMLFALTLGVSLISVANISSARRWSPPRSTFLAKMRNLMLRQLRAQVKQLNLKTYKMRVPIKKPVFNNFFAKLENDS